jgi:hypothetical protein
VATFWRVVNQRLAGASRTRQRAAAGN